MKKVLYVVHLECDATDSGAPCFRMLHVPRLSLRDAERDAANHDEYGKWTVTADGRAFCPVHAEVARAEVIL